MAPDQYIAEGNTLLTNPREIFFKYKEMLLGQSDARDGLPKLGQLETEDLLAKSQELRIVWLGHATVWIAVKRKKQRIHIITDPIFGNAYRFHKRLLKFPIDPQDLPPIDVVLLSHAHPDHLDIDSLRQIQDQNPSARIFLPDGNRAFAKEEGIEQAEIIEWWQSVKIKGIQITFTPSHHWTRMALNDKFQSHWGSFIIKIGKRRVFFSGDTGYSFHFKKIMKQYPGAFDAVLLEIRKPAYWSSLGTHLSPEQAIQVYRDLKAKLLLPIHWGTFPSNHGKALEAIEHLEQLLVKNKNQVKALLWHPGHPGVTFTL